MSDATAKADTRDLEHLEAAILALELQRRAVDAELEAARAEQAQLRLWIADCRKELEERPPGLFGDDDGW